MTVDVEELRKALAPITNIEKTERVEVDVLKVAKALVDETTTLASAEDPMAGLDALCERVEKIGDLLDKAEEDDKGAIFVQAVPEGVAKEFAKDKACAPGKKPKKAEDAPADTKKDDETEAGEGDAQATETQKDEDGLSDDIAWERDLAPAKPPTTLKERLTKAERPVPARRGAPDRMRKWEEARDRAMGRGDRCMK